MTKPNFFIVGGTKCGTTSLMNYLSEHPEIFIPQQEIHYKYLEYCYLSKTKSAKLK